MGNTNTRQSLFQRIHARYVYCEVRTPPPEKTWAIYTHRCRTPQYLLHQQKRIFEHPVPSRRCPQKYSDIFAVKMPTESDSHAINIHSKVRQRDYEHPGGQKEHSLRQKVIKSPPCKLESRARTLKCRFLPPRLAPGPSFDQRLSEHMKIYPPVSNPKRPSDQAVSNDTRRGS